MLVIPAVLPSSRIEFEEKLALLTQIPHVSRVQIDVVDGKFAEPASWPASADMRQMITSSTFLPQLDHIAYEIDLMCFDAEKAVGDWLALGASRFTLHAESTPDLPNLLASVKRQYGGGNSFISRLVSLGLALDITSNLALIEESLEEVEYVQFMGIEQIGRQGEPFDERVYAQIQDFHARHPEIPMQVDGGVSLANAKTLLALGVSNLVVGSGILRSANPHAAFAEFENLDTSFGV
jgi:ribulose-phosphate 3-epimerase